MTTTQTTTQKKRFPGSTLKIIACITMLLDHIGASLLETVLFDQLAAAGVTTWNYETLVTACPNIGIPYVILRCIGRIAFPIFCFLLVEGFLHTKNVGKYAFRLLLFAFISEVPFDLAFQKQAFYWEYQNVYFTLFLGLMVILLLHSIETKFPTQWFPRMILSLLAISLGTSFAELLHTDYGLTGVLVITAMYLFRNHHISEMVSGCLILSAMSSLEIVSIVNIPLISRYNGERGLNLKYFFYAFYPVHLLLLYGIGWMFGI